MAESPTLPGKTGMLLMVLRFLITNLEIVYIMERLMISQFLPGGDGYDVINPPYSFNSRLYRYWCYWTSKCKGDLDRIDVIDPGFDYVTDPTITISGGNGSGATADVNTKLITHSVSFYATSDNPQVGLSSNTIGFTTFHKFRESEKVIYKTDGQTAVGGISDRCRILCKNN